jgi:hypothetical protein
MRVDLGAKVRTSDGELAGRVHRAVINPYTTAVTEFVISTAGWLAHDVLVSRDYLEASTQVGDEVVLGLTSDEFKALPAYTPADYTEPPSGWRAPDECGYPGSAWLFAVTNDWHKQFADQDVLLEKEPEQWPDIQKGAVVRDRNGMAFQRSQ